MTHSVTFAIFLHTMNKDVVMVPSLDHMGLKLKIIVF